MPTLIHTRLSPVACLAVLRATPDGLRRSPLPLVEELPEVSLALRIPSRRDEAAAAGVAFTGMELELTASTAHIGVSPADARLLLAIWYDNLSPATYHLLLITYYSVLTT